MELVENAIGVAGHSLEGGEESQRGEGRKKEACNGMCFGANGRDTAPPSIPRSLQRISTDKFLPCLCRFFLAARISLKFPRSRPVAHLNESTKPATTPPPPPRVLCFFLSFVSASRSDCGNGISSASVDILRRRVCLFIFRSIRLDCKKTKKRTKKKRKKKNEMEKSRPTLQDRKGKKRGRGRERARGPERNE